MCYKQTFYVDVNAFLPQNLMILKADISKTSTGRYIFLFIFICGNSKCTRIQKIKNFSGEVNWVLLALSAHIFAVCKDNLFKFSVIVNISLVFHSLLKSHFLLLLP